MRAGQFKPENFLLSVVVCHTEVDPEATPIQEFPVQQLKGQHVTELHSAFHQVSQNPWKATDKRQFQKTELGADRTSKTDFLPLIFPSLDLKT